MVPRLRSRFVIVAHCGKGTIVGELVSYVGHVSLMCGCSDSWYLTYKEDE